MRQIKFLIIVLLVFFGASLGIRKAQFAIHSVPSPSPSLTTSPAPLQFDLADYTNCQIIKRQNINNPPGSNTDRDKSYVSCLRDDQSFALVEVVDLPGPDPGKNSINRIWHDGQGFQILLVDSHGAGSGEGVAKILTLSDDNYVITSCFSYVPEDFDTYNSPRSLSKRELENITDNHLVQTEPSCTNFHASVFLSQSR